MTETQQYRVHACSNNGRHEPHEFRGTYRKPSLPGVEITETFQCEGIERPAPTTEQANEQPSPHPPTREQIAETIRDALDAGYGIIAPGDMDEAVGNVLAVIQNGAAREWPAADDGSDLTWRERNEADRG